MGHLRRIGSFLFAVATLLPACASLPPAEGVRPPLPSSREYLARGMAELEAADKLRLEKSRVPGMGMSGMSAEYDQWLRHLRQAESDFGAVRDRFPASPEAAEAGFMLGRVYDYPNLSRFDDAVAEYRRTVERYPGTAAAEKARRRIEVIESIRK